MSSSPAQNDNRFSLIFKAAYNWYLKGVADGLTGLTPPSLNDTSATLLRKTAYYTARIADAS